MTADVQQVCLRRMFSLRGQGCTFLQEGSAPETSQPRAGTPRRMEGTEARTLGGGP